MDNSREREGPVKTQNARFIDLNCCSAAALQFNLGDSIEGRPQGLERPLYSQHTLLHS